MDALAHVAQDTTKDHREHAEEKQMLCPAPTCTHSASEGVAEGVKRELITVSTADVTVALKANTLGPFMVVRWAGWAPHALVGVMNEAAKKQAAIILANMDLALCRQP